MQEINKALQGIGIPHSALLSIIFGMMLLSFPIGAYVFFNSDMGQDITHEYPLAYVDFVLAPAFDLLPFEVSLGDGFIAIWSAFVIIFAVGMSGPRQHLIRTLLTILMSGRHSAGSNYLASALTWFGVLVLASVAIDTVQGSFGITIEPPDFGDDLTQFFTASLAPFVEELGFRVVLIGLPLCAMFYRSTSLAGLVRSLWHPYAHLDAPDPRLVLALIVAAGTVFGLMHVVVGDPWSIGKLAQASVGGAILGWVYYRYGLLAAILLHWTTNYFLLSYVYFVAHLSGIPTGDAYSHPLMGTLELLFVVSGSISIVFLATNYIQSRRSPGLRA